MLALFYWIVDVKGWRGWILFFKVIGMNSITIYMAQRILGFREIAKCLFGGTVTLLPQAWQGGGTALAYVAVCWLFLYLLYRKNVFLKV